MFALESAMLLLSEATELSETQPDLAKKMAANALQGVDENTQPALCCDAWEIIGQAERLLGDPVAASQACEKAVGYAVRSGDTYRHAKTLKALGTTLIDMNSHQQAMDCFFQVQDLAEQHGYPLLKYQADNNIAILYQLNGDAKKACDIFTELFENVDTYGLSWTIAHLNLADIHLNLQEPDKARMHLREGKKAAIKENKEHLLPAFLHLSGWYLLQKNYLQKAEMMLCKALSACEASHQYEDHVGCLQKLTDLCLIEKRWAEAAEWARKAMSLSEKLGLMSEAIHATECLILANQEQQLNVAIVDACRTYAELLNRRAELRKSRTRVLINLEWRMQQEKLAHHRLERSMARDPLTGLLSTRLLLPVLQQLTEQKLPENRFAVAYLDIDNLKPVNDLYGHDAGDRLLLLFADGIRSCLDKKAKAFRKSGDEFVVLMPDADRNQAAQFGKLLLTKINDDNFHIDEGIHVSCSIGISLFPEDGSIPENLLEMADKAMYHVKAVGKGGFRFYMQEGGLE